MSYAAVLLTGPLVGAWADAHAAKKRLLLATTVGCVIFTAALYYAGPGAVALALALLIVSNYFFGAGENLIAAFLPELAELQAMGRVSGWGWSFGYLGGLAALGICLAYITQQRKAGERNGAGHDADHGGVLRARRGANVPLPARARAAAAAHGESMGSACGTPCAQAREVPAICGAS